MRFVYQNISRTRSKRFLSKPKNLDQIFQRSIYPGSTMNIHRSAKNCRLKRGLVRRVSCKPHDNIPDLTIWIQFFLVRR